MGKRLKKARKAIGKRLKKRAKEKANVMADILWRLYRIEQFLEPDLSEFHEKPKVEANPLAAAGAS